MPEPTEPEVRVTGSSAEQHKRGGFDLARKLPNAAFRDYLSEAGWMSGRRVIMCADTDTLTYALDRLEQSGDSRAIVAIPDGSKPYGFRLATIQTHHGADHG